MIRDSNYIEGTTVPILHNQWEYAAAMRVVEVLESERNLHCNINANSAYNELILRIHDFKSRYCSNLQLLGNNVK